MSSLDFPLNLVFFFPPGTHQEALQCRPELIRGWGGQVGVAGNSRCVQGTGSDSGLITGEVVKSLDSEVTFWDYRYLLAFSYVIVFKVTKLETVKKKKK